MECLPLKGVLILAMHLGGWGRGDRNIFIIVGFTSVDKNTFLSMYLSCIHFNIVGHCNGKNGESSFTSKLSPAAWNFGSANVTPQLFTTVFIALSLAYK